MQLKTSPIDIVQVVFTSINTIYGYTYTYGLASIFYMAIASWRK